MVNVWKQKPFTEPLSLERALKKYAKFKNVPWRSLSKLILKTCGTNKTNPTLYASYYFDLRSCQLDLMNPADGSESLFKDWESLSKKWEKGINMVRKGTCCFWGFKLAFRKIKSRHGLHFAEHCRVLKKLQKVFIVWEGVSLQTINLFTNPKNSNYDQCIQPLNQEQHDHQYDHSGLRW